jgi:2-dehydro-3-deoxygalactonokinase
VNVAVVNAADAPLIGLDWGTSSLRAYLFQRNGEVTASRALPTGIMRITTEGSGPLALQHAFEHILEQACGDWMRAWPAASLIACGMIGSAQGWREAAYVDVPTTLDRLGGALTRVETRSGAVLHIIPGLIERGPLPDVMRGEETQVAGALELATPSLLPGADTLIGLPGTHSKWVRVRDRAIVHFHTFMTGEVFAALCEHTILGRTMRRTATPDHRAFDRGVEVARSPQGRAGVLSTMFSTRALGLIGALAAEAQADYLSGVLIGHEIAALAQLGEHLDPIVLVGSDDLCQRYQRALSAFGHAPPVIAAGATERGLWRIASSAGLVPQGTPC